MKFLADSPNKISFLLVIIFCDALCFSNGQQKFEHFPENPEFGAKISKPKNEQKEESSYDEARSVRNRGSDKIRVRTTSLRDGGSGSLPPGVLIRPGLSMGIDQIDFKRKNVTRKSVRKPPTRPTPSLASLGLPINHELVATLNKHLAPGQTIDSIQADLSEMLFGQKDIKKSTTTRSPNTRRATRVPPTTTSPRTKSKLVIDGDRGPEYGDYDYRDFDTYYDNNDDEIKKKTDENKVKKEDKAKVDDKPDNGTMEAEESVLHHFRNMPAHFPLGGPPQHRRHSGPHLMSHGPPNGPPQNGKVFLGRRNRTPFIPLRNNRRFNPQTLLDDENDERLGDNESIFDSTEDDFEPEIASSPPFFPLRHQAPSKRKQEGFQNLRSSLASSSGIGKSLRNNPDDCDYYTSSLCLSVNNYPDEEILGILNRNRRVGENLIADVIDQSADNLIDGVTSAQESSYTFSHYFGENRRQDGPGGHRDFAQEGGFMCPSEIMYAKPKRGKTAQGEWKDIVNVKDYTQTLRMEKCLKPGGTCSYVSHHYKSQCSQVYNYHRLLSWNKERGLHMDIYKVPTCCSCHIMGYSYVYPPLKNSHPTSDILTPSSQGGFGQSGPHAGEEDIGFVPSNFFDDHGSTFHEVPQSFDAFDEVDGFSREEQVIAAPPQPSSSSHPAGGDVTFPTEDSFLPTKNEVEFAENPQEDFKKFMSTMSDHFPDGDDFGIEEQPSDNMPNRVPPPRRPHNKKNRKGFLGGRVGGLPRLNFGGKGVKRRRIPQRNVPRRRMDTGEDNVRMRPLKQHNPPQKYQSKRGKQVTAVPTIQKKPNPPKVSISATVAAPSVAQKEKPTPNLKAAKSETTTTEEETKPKTIQSSMPKEVKTDEKEKKTVNYAYHPIIDFFDRYRWSAAAS